MSTLTYHKDVFANENRKRPVSMGTDDLGNAVSFSKPLFLGVFIRIDSWLEYNVNPPPTYPSGFEMNDISKLKVRVQISDGYIVLFLVSWYLLEKNMAISYYLTIFWHKTVSVKRAKQIAIMIMMLAAWSTIICNSMMLRLEDMSEKVVNFYCKNNLH